MSKSKNQQDVNNWVRCKIDELGRSLKPFTFETLRDFYRWEKEQLSNPDIPFPSEKLETFVCDIAASDYFYNKAEDTAEFSEDIPEPIVIADTDMCIVSLLKTSNECVFYFKPKPACVLVDVVVITDQLLITDKSFKEGFVRIVISLADIAKLKASEDTTFSFVVLSDNSELHLEVHI